MENGFEGWRIRATNIAIKASSKVNQAGRITVEKRGARAGASAPATDIHNKMKAIRGDNPRTTNQRVYLMPVVPPSPPENLPTLEMQRVRTLSLSLSRLPVHPAISLFIYIYHPLAVSLALSLLSCFLCRQSRDRHVFLSSRFAFLCCRRRRRRCSLLDKSPCYKHNRQRTSPDRVRPHSSRFFPARCVVLQFSRLLFAFPR